MCFERVPRAELVEEARAVGYPLSVLRLAIAAYTLPRTVAVDGAHSRPVVAERGITAGSGLATFELRMLLIRMLDNVARKHPNVGLTICVDDSTFECTGTSRAVVQAITAAGTAMCDGFIALGLTVSKTKSVVLASSAALATEAARGLRRFGVTPKAQSDLPGTTATAGGPRRTARQIEIQCPQIDACEVRVSAAHRHFYAEAVADWPQRCGGLRR